MTKTSNLHEWLARKSCLKSGGEIVINPPYDIYKTIPDQPESKPIPVIGNPAEISTVQAWLSRKIKSKPTRKNAIGSVKEAPNLQEATAHPDCLKQLSCYSAYSSCTSRLEKNGLLFKLWENEGALTDDERRLMAYLEEELGAPVTRQ